MNPSVVRVPFTRQSALVAVLSFVGALACSATQGPEARTQMTIYGIQVPSHAATNDSIRVSFFTASKSCLSTDRIVEIEFLTGGVKFAATSVPLEGCPPTSQVAPVPFVYVVPPFHTAPFTVRFAEPGAADSVRVIPAQ